MNIQQPIEIDINALAKDALAQVDNDIAKALVLLMEKGDADDLVYRAIMRPLYRTACYELLARQIRSERSKIWAPKKATVTKANSRALDASTRLLMNFPLPGGLQLGSARKSEVECAAQFYERQSSDMAGKHRWLARIAKSMPGNKKVSDVFTEKKLRELQEQER